MWTACRGSSSWPRPSLCFMTCTLSTSQHCCCRHQLNTSVVFSEGLREKDKNSISTILGQVGLLNPKDHSFSLRQDLFAHVRLDWPDFKADDINRIKRCDHRHLFTPPSSRTCAPLKHSIFDTFPNYTRACFLPHAIW